MSEVRVFFDLQVTPFVILFVERAGSTYLITALKSHPGVLALTEKFDALRKEGKGSAEQLEWAKAFLTPPLLGRHRAIGFKTKLVDVLDPGRLCRAPSAAQVQDYPVAGGAIRSKPWCRP